MTKPMYMCGRCLVLNLVYFFVNSFYGDDTDLLNSCFHIRRWLGLYRFFQLMFLYGGMGFRPEVRPYSHHKEFSKPNKRFM